MAKTEVREEVWQFMSVVRRESGVLGGGQATLVRTVFLGAHHQNSLCAVYFRPDLFDALGLKAGKKYKLTLRRETFVAEGHSSADSAPVDVAESALAVQKQ